MYSHKRAKALWKSCVEHHSFFRLERPNRLPRFLPLSLGSRFYYSGRTEVQAVQESRQRAPISKVFNRSPSKRLMAVEAAAASGGATTSADASGDSADAAMLPKTNGGGTATNGGSAAADNGGAKVFRRGLDGLAKAYRPHSDGHNRVTSVTAPNSLPRKAWEQHSDEYVYMHRNIGVQVILKLSSFTQILSLRCSEGGFIVRCAKSYDAPGGPLSEAVLDHTSHQHPGSHPGQPSAPVTAAAAAAADQQRRQQLQQRSVTPIHLERLPLAAVDPDDPALVRIRLQADEHGRFGFNVRGGVDLKLPVLVSRVAPHTPADRTVPRICEGDQVVLINGQDVSALQHEQVVALIRASRESADGALVLTVKPNGMCGLSYVVRCIEQSLIRRLIGVALIDPSEEEPLYQYVPDSGLNGCGMGGMAGGGHQLHGDALFTQSLLLLGDGLASGALLSQYEQMYRKNGNLAITEARKADNVAKNRYRDISPCKCQQLVLHLLSGGATVDYKSPVFLLSSLPPPRRLHARRADQRGQRRLHQRQLREHGDPGRRHQSVHCHAGPVGQHHR